MLIRCIELWTVNQDFCVSPFSRLITFIIMVPSGDEREIIDTQAYDVFKTNNTCPDEDCGVTCVILKHPHDITTLPERSNYIKIVNGSVYIYGSTIKELEINLNDYARKIRMIRMRRMRRYKHVNLCSLHYNVFAVYPTGRNIPWSWNPVLSL